ncbi:MAG: phospholipid scramblase-related protein [Myxococcales bacterium]
MTRCPACSALLFRRVFSSVEVDGCPACGGIWLDKGELQSLARDSAALRAMERTFVPGSQANKPERTNLCPRCQAPLTQFEFDAFRGIRLDRCKTCGGLFMEQGKAGKIAERLEPSPQAGPAPVPTPTPTTAAPAVSPSPSLAVRFGAAAPGPAAAADPTGGIPAAGPIVAATVPVRAPVSTAAATAGLGGGFWETLRATDFALIQQQFEIAELFGFESRNKYAIRTESGFIGWAAEQSKDLFGFLLRQVLGHWRPFEIHLFDGARQPVLRAVHPFRLLFQRLEIFLQDGTRIGALQQRFSIFSKRFDVEDASGRVIMTVSSPLWRIWTFPFMRAGQQVGVIEKHWSGFLTEAMTDRDRFYVRFTPGLTDQERALLVVAGLFVDLIYFEHKAS